MKIEFNSDLFIEDKHEKILGKVFRMLIGGMILVKTFIEILTSNFNIIHTLYILFAIIIIIAWSLMGFKLIQCAALGEIEFKQDKVTIAYKDIHGGKNVKLYSIDTTIQYDKIKSIGYDNDLYCFEIEANCFTKHTYMRSRKKNLISDTKEENKIFIYVRDSDTASNILNNLEKYTGIAVKILE